jgi:para-nitrobenzyl esterase
MRTLITALTLGAAIVMTPMSPSPRSAHAHRVNCLVTIANGPIQGVDQGTSCQFLGIPFAASTGGNNRWKPPQPAPAWGPATLPANAAGQNCPGFSGTGAAQGSEDCLKLNIWVRDPTGTGAPVIVWIHTGGFLQSSANFAGSNGKKFAEETGVIVVEANYRLGPFGFLAHSALEAEDPARRSTGNYGLLDQRAALVWVRDNIAQFGGDPANVTVAGTSAGGQSAGLHLVSPGSSGLFQRAIVQSAYPTTAWSSLEEAEAQGNAFAASLGCTNPAQALTCLRGKSRDQVLNALPLATEQVVEPPNRFFWQPIVDGIEIPDQPRRLFERGDFEHVPTLIGSTRDEGWLFTSRSFPAGVSLSQYLTWLASEFGDEADQVAAAYPAANYPSPQEALARVVGDGQFVCEARRLGDLIADGGLRGRGPHEEHGVGKRVKSPVYLYSYEYVIDDLSLGHVPHGVEGNIIFGNNYSGAPFNVNHALTVADLTLHTEMAGYWARFAATGDPNGGNALEWPEYRKNHENHIVFDLALSSGADLRQEACEFWSPFFLHSMVLGVPAVLP